MNLRQRVLSELGQSESRMTVGSSGMGPYDIVNDLTAAAKRLNRERRLPNTERSIQLPAHGGPLGIGREEGGIWLTHADLWSANQYRTQLEKAYKKWILGKARGDADLEATGMREFKNLADHPGRPLYEALQDAASAMEAAGVDYVELQACKTSTDPPGAAGVDSLGTSVNPLLGRLLSTYSHQVKVLGHATLLDTEAIGNKVTVSLSGTKFTSTDTLPVPQNRQ